MFQKIFSKFRTNLISGAFALTPLAVVLWILAWVWNIILGLRYILPQSLNPREFLNIENPVVGSFVDLGVTFVLLATVIIGIATVGLVSRNILGKKFLKFIEKFVNRLPVLSTVYSTLQQLMQTFAGSQGKNFSKVVMIEYPRTGIYTLALVTGELNENAYSGSRAKHYNVFVPTTPNPTSGFFLTVPASDAKEMKMSVEEALKQIISMGMVR